MRISLASIFFFGVFLFMLGCTSLRMNETSYHNRVALSDSVVDLKHVAQPLPVYDYAIHLSSAFWSTAIEKFYQKNSMRTVWVTTNGLNFKGKMLVEFINDVEEKGLNPNDYGWINIHAYNNTINTLRKENYIPRISMVRLDIMLTYAYFLLGYDLAHGTVNPKLVEKDWEHWYKSENIENQLYQGVVNENILATLHKLEPDHVQYVKLKKSLNNLQQKKQTGDWPYPGYGPTVSPGDTGRYIKKIKHYLKATGDYVATEQENEAENIFDLSLNHAVKQFQKRHGLVVDGIVGKQTMAEMNIPIDERINQILVNLDRYRWREDFMPEEYISINIPAFKLKYFKNKTLENQMRIIVGSEEDYTPVLKDTLDYIVFNPNWFVPDSIAINELLPKIKTDTQFLSRNNYEVRPRSTPTGKPVPTNKINWDTLSKDYFPYRIVQLPGDNNALGKVKFIFRNKNAIYLHDTPKDHLFTYSERDFSHGCIRLEKPFVLAENLLNHSDVDSDSIRHIIDSDSTIRVNLNRTIPIYFTYYTAWIDEHEKLNFRKDIYQFDRKHARLFGSLPRKTKIMYNKNANIMAWTKTDYPEAMKNLDEQVRNKAIEIANKLLDEKQMEEGRAISIAISQAKKAYE